MQVNATPPSGRESMRRCPRCGGTKPRSAFYTRRNNQPSSYCRECQRVYSRLSYRRLRKQRYRRQGLAQSPTGPTKPEGGEAA